MKDFREYVEEKEADNLLKEDLVSVAGNILGFSTAGLLVAWLGSLLVKGYAKVAKSYKNSLKEIYQKAESSPAVKQQEVQAEKREDKFSPDCEELLNAIKNKDWQTAHEVFHSLPREKQQSTEFKKFVIEKIVECWGPTIFGVPTPGTPSFQGIRKTIDLPTAKLMAKAFEEKVSKLS